MKKFIAIGLSVVLLLTGIVPAFAMYSPPSRVTPTKEDIAVGENFFKNLKWDLSKAASGQITLNLPNVPSKYLLVADQWYIDDRNFIAGGNKIHQGNGGITFSHITKIPMKNGYHFSLVNDSTSALIAIELYTYTNGDKMVKYVPFEERQYPILEDNGEIKYWVDDLGNRINEDGTIYDSQNPILPKPVFWDVKSTFWGFKDINALSGSEYIKGYPDGTFKPGNKITRAEFMVMLGNVLKDKWVDGKSYNHTDEKEIVSLSHWSHGIVTDTLKYLPENDISLIFGSDFNPDQYITREEVVAVLASVLSVHKNFQNNPPGYVVLSDLNTSKFPDLALFSVKQNLVSGYPDSTFKPQNSITRAEITAIMIRMIEKL